MDVWVIAGLPTAGVSPRVDTYPAIPTAAAASTAIVATTARRRPRERRAYGFPASAAWAAATSSPQLAYLSSGSFASAVAITPSRACPVGSGLMSVTSGGASLRWA